eukprot:558620-Hanusia_phi.AAC.1
MIRRRGRGRRVDSGAAGNRHFQVRRLNLGPGDPGAWQSSGGPQACGRPGGPGPRWTQDRTPGHSTAQSDLSESGAHGAAAALNFGTSERRSRPAPLP